MKSKASIVIAFLSLAAFGLVACERSMTTGPLPLPTATATAEIGFETGFSEEGLPTEDPIQLLYAYATQTAAALGLPTETPAGATPGAELTPEGEAITPVVTPFTGTESVPISTPWVVVPTATPGLPLTYTLQPREFPYCIARRFNLDPEELLALNNLKDGQLFMPGLELKIPQSGKTFPGERALIPHPATYTVQANDTIYSIACAYGDVDPMMIAYANNLTPPYTLTAGQVLNIP